MNGIRTTTRSFVRNDLAREAGGSACAPRAPAGTADELYGDVGGCEVGAELEPLVEGEVGTPTDGAAGRAAVSEPAGGDTVRLGATTGRTEVGPGTVGVGTLGAGTVGAGTGGCGTLGVVTVTVVIGVGTVTVDVVVGTGTLGTGTLGVGTLGTGTLGTGTVGTGTPGGPTAASACAATRPHAARATVPRTSRYCRS